MSVAFCQPYSFQTIDQQFYSIAMPVMWSSSEYLSSHIMRYLADFKHNVVLSQSLRCRLVGVVVCGTF